MKIILYNDGQGLAIIFMHHRFKIMEDPREEKLAEAKEIYRRIDSRNFYSVVRTIYERDYPRTAGKKADEVGDDIRRQADAGQRNAANSISVLKKEVKSGAQLRRVSEKEICSCILHIFFFLLLLLLHLRKEIQS